MEIKNYSLADQVFERLEEDILSGKIPHGMIFTENELSAKMGVSRTPIREALVRLEQERLISDTGKGIKILGVTKEDLLDIMEVRLRLDGVAARRCAERITDEEIAEMRKTLELQEFYLQKSNTESIQTMDSRFHEQIYRYSGSAVLYDTLTPLHNRVQRYRKAALENTGRAENSFGEHKKIFEAIAAHDADLAEKYMTEHAKRVIDNIHSARILQEG